MFSNSYMVRVCIFFRKIFVSVASVLVTLLILEVFLVMLKYTPSSISYGWIWRQCGVRLDLELMYSLRPDTTCDDLSINSLGVKSRDSLDNGPPNEAGTIVMLGDSFVWGNTSFEYTYPAQLQQILDDKDYYVVNGGVSGYGTDQSYSFFIKRLLPRIKPDVVIWNININDVYDNVDRPLYTLDGNSLVPVPVWTTGVFLSSFLASKMPDTVRSNSRLVHTILSALEKVRLHTFIPSNSIEWSLSKIMVEIHALSDVARAGNFKLYIVLSPDQSIVEKFPDNEDNKNIYNLLKERLGNYLAIDQNESLSMATGSAAFVLGDHSNSLFLDESDSFEYGSWHPNEYGNFFMASSVYEHIILKQ